MNLFLDTRYSESVQRLALGIECVDALLGMRIGYPVEVTVDGVPHPVSPRLRASGASLWSEPNLLESIPRHNSCRHVLLVRPGVDDAAAIRIRDRRQRLVPRRINVELPTPIDRGRAVRPALFPGAAYPLGAGAIGMRGRVERGGEPMRWARVEARRTTDDLLVGSAQGDEHGEFVLLLSAEAGRGADLVIPIRVRVTVFGPGTAPDPAANPDSAVDPLWDLPLEDGSIGSTGEAVLAGRQLPAGYVSTPGSTREVDFGWHGLVREEFDFS